MRIIADDPPAGMVFAGWRGDIAQIEAVDVAETMIHLLETGSVAVEAGFRPAISYQLKVEHGAGSAAVPEEDWHQITATVPDGQSFDIWTGDIEGVEYVRSPGTRIKMPARDATVTAVFVEDAVFSPLLQNPSFEDGIEGWQAREKDVRIVENEDGSRHLAVQPFSGIMQRIEGMQLEPGQRLTLYFEAKIEAERSPEGFVGMQFLGEDEEELVHTAVTVRNHEWTPLAVSGVSVEGVLVPNIFVWMRRGELYLRNFRLRVH